jgi:WD40 repeat protein
MDVKYPFGKWTRLFSGTVGGNEMRQGIANLFTHAIIAALALALFAEAYAGDAKKPRIDAHGEALPEGALLRLGSMRWRHGEPITFVAAPPNGKTLITASNDATLLIWDRATGKLLHRLAPPAGDPNVYIGVRNNPYTQGLTRAAMTSDGKLLAVVLPTNAVQLWEVETGKALWQIKGFANGSFAMTFAANGKTLAVRGGDRVTYLYETATGKELRKLKTEQPEGQNRVIFGTGSGSGIAFSPDGRTLAMPDLEVINQKIIGFITFLDTDSGKVIRRLQLPNTAIYGLAYSPDGKIFAHAVSNKITLNHADTGKEIRQFNSNLGANLIVFAPDSQSMAINGRDGAVRLYDSATGNLIRTFGEPPAAPGVNAILNYNSTAAADVVFAADGKTLIVGGAQAPRFFDVGTGKEQELPSGGHRGAVSNVIVTPDGKTMLSRGADNVVRVWNAATGAELRQFAEPRGTSSVAFSPDAKLVALGNADGTIRLIEVEAGKEKRQLHGHKGGIATLAFSADGKKLASRGSYDGVIRIFDVEKGAVLKHSIWQTINVPANGGAFIVRSGNGVNGGQPLIFSPDGQTLATYVAPLQLYVQGQQQQQPGSNTLRFWDVATAKEMRQIELPPGRTINQLVYSPDGRLLISENIDKTVSIWEAASGRERNHLGEPIAGPASNVTTSFVVVNGIIRNGVATAPVGMTIASSPDGSLIASPGANHSVRVWDTALGKEVGSFKGHHGAIASLSFAPDGKTLVSGTNDTTILVWDLSRLKREPRLQIAELPPVELDKLWADLISNDTVAAGKSVHTMIAAAKPSVALLEERMQPAAPVDPKKLDQWINDLDSSMFTKRSAAISQLEKLGELAIPALKKVLTGKASLETRRRVEPLLEKLTSGTFTAEQIRIIRAIEVLDKIGTPEARHWLERLATGAPGALTTRQAQAALARYANARRQP